MELYIKNDEDCHRELQLGNTAGLRYIIRIYFPVLRDYALQILRTNEAAAEDIVEEVLIKVWERTGTFSDFGEIKGFLYTSVRNACLNHLRSLQREQARVEAFTQMHIDPAANFETEIIQAEVLADLRKSVTALPVKMREVFILSHYRKMTNQEIADHLNLSQQTIRNQKTKAIHLIKQWFKHRSAFFWLAISLLQ